MSNLLTKAPKSTQHFVAAVVRSIFAQPDAEAAHEQHRHVINQPTPRFPEATQLLDEAGPDLLTFTVFSAAHWHQIWSKNRSSCSTRRSVAAPVSSASFPAALRSSASSVRSSPSSATSGS